jgi:hypothetical protein
MIFDALFRIVICNLEDRQRSSKEMTFGYVFIVETLMQDGD